MNGRTLVIGIALIPLFVAIWLVIDAFINFGGILKGRLGLRRRNRP